MRNETFVVFEIWRERVFFRGRSLSSVPPLIPLRLRLSSRLTHTASTALPHSLNKPTALYSVVSLSPPLPLSLNKPVAPTSSPSLSPFPPSSVHLNYYTLNHILKYKVTPRMKSISLFTLVGAVASISTSVSAHSPHSDSSIHRRFHHKQLASLQAETTALAVRGESDENKHELMKRGNFNGRATFFDPGLGACGTYSSGNDFVSTVNTTYSPPPSLLSFHSTW